jgi:hypothetical protein
MSQDKEKIVDVKITKNGKEETIKLLIKKPSNALMSSAQRIGAKVWTDCVRDGIMTKKELEKFMNAQGVWDKNKDAQQKEITDTILDLEKQLYVSGKNGKLRASDGKRIAIEMRKKRNELRDLISERLSLEQNTAESISDNSKFDFLVSNCAFYENGNKVYNDLEDYQRRSDDEIGYASATALASMLYSVDKDFEAKLPENKFLKMFHYVDDNLSLVNEKGETVDLDGRRIDSQGYYINSEGKRTDKEGNLLDDSGNYVPSLTYLDDNDQTLEEPKATAVQKVKKSKSSDS